MLTMGGLEQTTPVHAIVIMLGRPPLSWQVTRAAGTGARKVEGLIERFFMGDPLEKWNVEGGKWN
jgi:hypothetical protein